MSDEPAHAEAVRHAVAAHERVRREADQAANRIRNRRGIRRTPSDRWEPFQ